MAFDLKQFRDQHADEYGNADLQTVAEDLYFRTPAYRNRFRTSDEFLKASGLDKQIARHQEQDTQQGASSVGERGFLGDIGSSVARGAARTAGLTGHMLQTLDPDGGIDFFQGVGERITRGAEHARENWDIMQPDRSERTGDDPYVWGGMKQGFESFMPSLAGGLGGAAAGGAAGSFIPGVGTAIGAGVGGFLGSMGLFGFGTYGEKKKEATEKGLSEQEAHNYALTQGLVEGGGEAVSNLLAMATFGLFKPFGQAVKQPVKETLKQVLKTPKEQILRNFLVNTATNEVPTEMVQEGLQAKIDQEYGMGNVPWQQAAKDAIIPAITMSALFGLGVEGLNTYQRKKTKEALNSDNEKARKQAAESVRMQLQEEDTELAMAWNEMAEDKIANGEAIPLDENFAHYIEKKKQEERSQEYEPPQDLEKESDPENLITGGQKDTSPEDILTEEDVESVSDEKIDQALGQQAGQKEGQISPEKSPQASPEGEIQGQQTGQQTGRLELTGDEQTPIEQQVFGTKKEAQKTANQLTKQGQASEPYQTEEGWMVRPKRAKKKTQKPKQETVQSRGQVEPGKLTWAQDQAGEGEYESRDAAIDEATRLTREGKPHTIRAIQSQGKSKWSVVPNKKASRFTPQQQKKRPRQEVRQEVAEQEIVQAEGQVEPGKQEWAQDQYTPLEDVFTTQKAAQKEANRLTKEGRPHKITQTDQGWILQPMGKKKEKPQEPDKSQQEPDKTPEEPLLGDPEFDKFIKDIRDKGAARYQGAGIKLVPNDQGGTDVQVTENGKRRIFGSYSDLYDARKASVRALDDIGKGKEKEGEGDGKGSTREPWQMTQKEWATVGTSSVLDDRKAQQHREAVESALNEGKDIPWTVLEDYPDLKKKSKEPKTEEPNTEGMSPGLAYHTKYRHWVKTGKEEGKKPKVPKGIKIDEVENIERQVEQEIREELNTQSDETTVQRLTRKIDEWVNHATKNGQREMDRQWEAGAIKRFLESEGVNDMLRGKQSGHLAAAKIAIGKADSFESLRKAVAKLDEKDIETKEKEARQKPFSPKDKQLGLNEDGNPVFEDGQGRYVIDTQVDGNKVKRFKDRPPRKVGPAGEQHTPDSLDELFRRNRTQYLTQEEIEERRKEKEPKEKRPSTAGMSPELAYRTKYRHWLQNGKQGEEPKVPGHLTAQVLDNIQKQEERSLAEEHKSPQNRPADWRGNLMKARQVAKNLGIEWKGKGHEDLLAEIDRVDAGEGSKQSFASYQEALEWIDHKAKEYGGKKKFTASDEYKAAFPEIDRLYQQEKAQKTQDADKAMSDAGVKYGDKVQYVPHNLWAAAAGPVTGTIVKRNGTPYVKVDEGQPVEIAGGKKHVRWHNGWQKMATEAAKIKPHAQIAQEVRKKLDQSQDISSKELTNFANEAYGGTQAQGIYTSKDAYDALEMGVNYHIMEHPDIFTPATNSVVDAQSIAQSLREKIKLVPTQTKRTEEFDEYQQFSTPPHIAYTAAWAANMKPLDVALEPSAGIGGLASFAKNANAKTVVNELSGRRGAILKDMGFDRVFTENAEQIHNILPKDVKPSVVLMNPPFSATAGRKQGERKTANAQKHIDQALSRLEPNGRLVAIVGRGMADDRPTMKKWWDKVKQKYNVRANVGISGKEYMKYGTSFDVQLLVIDKNGPTTTKPLTETFDTVEGAIAGLKEVRDARSKIDTEGDRPSTGTSTEQTLPGDAQEGQSGSGQGYPGGTGATGVGTGAEQGGDTTSVQGGSGTGNIQLGSVETTDSGQTAGGTGTGGSVSGSEGDTKTQESGPGGGTASESPAPGAGDQGGGVQPGDTEGYGSSNTLVTKDRYEELKKRMQEKLGRLNMGFDPEFLAIGTEMAAFHIEAGARKFKDFGQRMVADLGEKIKPYLKSFYKGAKMMPGMEELAKEMDSDQDVDAFDLDKLTEKPQKKAKKKQDIKEGKQEQKKELSDSVYEKYVPNVTLSNAQPHPGDLAESAAMAAVPAPKVKYKPSIPDEAVKKGLISDVQLEAVIYAGASHQQTLPNGERKGFFIGDGTGVGKGREIASIIWDNWNQGRKRHVWISKTQGLLKDAKRDMDGVGWDSGLIMPHSKVKAADSIPDQDGVLFTTYDTLKSEEKQENGKRRIDQVIEWLGKDFDGVIAFDESHKMGNAISIRGPRGRSKPSQIALTGLEIQNELPNARVVYVSATGATEVSNLTYAQRLGLWGSETPFGTVQRFISEVASGGVAAMELVASDLKAMGSYLARTLSYEGVAYDRMEHTLSSVQRQQYNKFSEAWQTVLNNVEAALAQTGGKRGAALSAFWGAQQRFYNQILTSMQVPSLLQDADKQLDSGNSVVVQLVNTNEAAQQRARAELEEGQDLEDLDLTPRQALMGFVENSFPVYQYEDVTDDNGNTVKQLVQDSEGNPVINQEAQEMKEQLLDELGSIQMVDGPLDMIINHFGKDNVAEMTGRSGRVVWGEDKDGNPKKVFEKRTSKSAEADADAFMDGKKRVLVFSEAGGTGASYHADLTRENQQKRIHYLLQPGWRADVAVQGLGRSHRSNQAQPPQFILMSTDVPAQKRFLSTIARRLDQLGALTKGQRQTGSQGFFQARDNLESDYAVDAMRQFITDLYQGGISGLSMDSFEQKTGLNLRDPDTGGLKQNLPPIRQILNRLLSLDLDTMNKVFEEFDTRMDEIVRQAAERGTLDVGIETLRAQSTKIVDEKTVNVEPKSGAETKYLQLQLTQPTEFIDFDTVKQQAVKEDSMPSFVKNNRSGKVWAVTSGPRTSTRSDGSIRVFRQLKSPTTVSRESEQKINDTDHFTPVGAEEARRMWDETIQNTPKTYTQDVHMISGAILPIWDRLAGEPKIVRALADDGRTVLGRRLPDRYVDDVLKKLGAGEKARPDLTPKQAVDAVLQNANQLVLANDWRIKRSLVSGEQRIELIGPDFTNNQEMDNLGVFRERINFKSRNFIPVDKAQDIIERLTKNRPIVDVIRSSQDVQFKAPTSKKPRGVKASAVRSYLDKKMGSVLSQETKDKIHIVQSPSRLPRPIFDRMLKSGGMENSPAAFWNGHIYMVANNMDNLGSVISLSLTHELTHMGFDNVRQGLSERFGGDVAKANKKVDKVLSEVAVRFRHEIRALEQGDYKGVYASMPHERRMRRMAEEILADNPEMFGEGKWYDRYMAAVAEFIREVAKALGVNVNITNAEVRDMLAIVGRTTARKNTRTVTQQALQQRPAYQARDTTAPTFYSQMQSVLEKKLPKSGTAGQFKQTIQSWAKKGQFKQAELEWSGIETWLDSMGKKAKVTRDQVLEYMRMNEVQVQEVKKGAISAETFRNNPEVQVDILHLQEAGLQADVSPDGDMVGFVDDQTGDILDVDDIERHFPDEPELAEAALRVQNVYENAETGGPVKYADYQVPGGENYQELLLTLPVASNTRFREIADEMADASPERYRELHEERARLASEQPEAYRTSHWSEPNVLVHVRFNERTVPVSAEASIADIESRIMSVVKASDPKYLANGAPGMALRQGVITEAEAGKYSAHRGYRNTGFKTEDRVLFIEEIQSDWHQKGRKKGYKGHEQWTIKQLPNGKWTIAAGDISTSVTVNSKEEAQKVLDSQEFKDVYGETPTNTNAVPDAPFKTTESWSMLIMKRMLRHASENGYDRIAWTPGEVQAERYDLSKQVRRIEWDWQDRKQGRKLVNINPIQGNVMEFAVNKDGIVGGVSGDRPSGYDFDGKHITDVVGKEIGERILNERDGSLSGGGLRVGGHGMKEFYDKMLPNNLNKYVKKWGAKVEQVEVDGIKAFSIPVTDQMQRDVLKQGQPLFQSQKNFASPNTFDRSNAMTPKRGPGKHSAKYPPQPGSGAGIPTIKNKNSSTGAIYRFDNVRQLIDGLIRLGTKGVFIRWSRGPAYDQKQKYSVDKVSGQKEEGLSAIQVEKEWLEEPWYLVRRLKEYAYGTRLNDPNIRGWMYAGKKLGEDSDGYDAIEIQDTLGVIGKRFLDDIDNGLARFLELQDSIEKDESKLKRLTDKSAIKLTQESLDKNKKEIEKYKERFKDYPLPKLTGLPSEGGTADIRFRRTSTKPIDTSNILSDEVRKRVQDAAGARADSLWERAKAKAAEFYEERKSPVEKYLDKTQDAQLIEDLRQHRGHPRYAQNKAYDNIKDFLKPLSKYGDKGKEVFTMNLLLDDMLKDMEPRADTGKPLLKAEDGLPFGFKTYDEVKQARDQYRKLARRHPEIKEALDKRNRFMQDLRQKLVKAKVLRKEVLNDPAYFHHQVLERLNVKNGKPAGAVGSKDVRNHWRGWMAGRKGSAKDYNTEYAIAEFEVISEGIQQYETWKTLQKVRKNYDMLPKLRDQAKEENMNNLMAKLEREGRLEQDVTGEWKDPLAPFKQKIAVGFGNLGKMAAKGELEYSSEWDHVVQDLIEEQARRKDHDASQFQAPITNPDVLNFLNYLLDKNKPGAKWAATVFKGIKERNQFIKNELGNDFLDWKAILKRDYPDHTTWRPKNGTTWYKTFSIPDQIIDQMMEKGKGEFTAQDLQEVKAIIPGEQWVIPDRVATQLDHFKTPMDEGPIGRASGRMLSAWKQWILLNPYRLIKYNLNNVSGDLDIATAYAPEIWSNKKFALQAARDLAKWHRGGELSHSLKQEMDEVLYKDVIDSGITVYEIDDLNEAIANDKFLRDLIGARNESVLKRGISRYWNGAKNFTRWRENVLRLAAYRFFKEKWEQGHKLYGASNPQMIDQLQTVEDKAARLARELIGDYGNISEAGEFLRKRLIPFWSWQEINAPRYVKLFRNLKDEGRGSRAAGLMAWKGTKLALKASALYAMVHLFNHLVHPDEEDELREYQRRQMHLILGRREDGSIISIRFQGALSDALSWFAAEDLPEDIEDLTTGQATVQGKLAEAAIAGPTKLFHGLRPEPKMLFEATTGRTLYPDPWGGGRPIRDVTEHILRTFSLDSIYNKAVGKPQKGGGGWQQWFVNDLKNLVTYETAPGEAAYYNVKKKMYDYLDEKGIERPSPNPTNRSNALYYYRQALKYGDIPAAAKYKKKYFELGGTHRGLQSSVKRAHPLAGLPKRLRYDFRRSLSPEEEQTLRRAIAWYRQTYQGRGY